MTMTGCRTTARLGDDMTVFFAVLDIYDSEDEVDGYVSLDS